MRIHGREANAKERALLDQQPDVDLAMQRCIDCWDDLDSCRQAIGAVTGAIPFPAILEWSRLHRLDRAWILLLVDVIGTLDTERAERIAAEIAAERQKAKAKR